MNDNKNKLIKQNNAMQNKKMKMHIEYIRQINQELSKKMNHTLYIIIIINERRRKNRRY